MSAIRRLLFQFVLVLFAATAIAHDEIPGARQAKPIVLQGATVHPVSSVSIAPANVLLVDGKVSAIGTDIQIPAEADHIDCTGLHIYPGLFDAHTMLGLLEIDAVRATRDVAETGSINPNVRAQIAVNPDSEMIPVTRSNGVLLALTAPEGGLISGQSAVMQLDGWTYEDMTLRGGVGLHVQWPSVPAALGGNASPDQDPLLSLQRLLQDVRAYQQAKNAGRTEVDLRWESMLPVLDGRLPLIVHANDIQRIQSSVAFADREKVRLIIYGGYDAPLCASLLSQHKVPVIVGGVYRLPLRRSDGYDAAYTVPERLRQAGVTFCIASGQDDASNIRNLPYHAAMASAFGLPRDEALKAVTLYPAQILGVADRVGSLEVGKDGTLIVTTGDPLETATQVQRAFIHGRAVDLNDRHKRLYQKYSEKYKRLQAAAP